MASTEGNKEVAKPRGGAGAGDRRDSEYVNSPQGVEQMAAIKGVCVLLHAWEKKREI
jgi:hypothetical protein